MIHLLTQEQFGLEIYKAFLLIFKSPRKIITRRSNKVSKSKHAGIREST